MVPRAFAEAFDLHGLPLRAAGDEDRDGRPRRSRRRARRSFRPSRRANNSPARAISGSCAAARWRSIARVASRAAAARTSQRSAMSTSSPAASVPLARGAGGVAALREGVAPRFGRARRRRRLADLVATAALGPARRLRSPRAMKRGQARPAPRASCFRRGRRRSRSRSRRKRSLLLLQRAPALRAFPARGPTPRRRRRRELSRARASVACSAARSRLQAARASSRAAAASRRVAARSSAARRAAASAAVELRQHLAVRARPRAPARRRRRPRRLPLEPAMSACIVAMRCAVSSNSRAAAERRPRRQAPPRPPRRSPAARSLNAATAAPHASARRSPSAAALSRSPARFGDRLLELRALGLALARGLPCSVHEASRRLRAARCASSKASQVGARPRRPRQATPAASSRAASTLLAERVEFGACASPAPRGAPAARRRARASAPWSPDRGRDPACRPQRRRRRARARPRLDRRRELRLGAPKPRRGGASSASRAACSRAARAVSASTLSTVGVGGERQRASGLETLAARASAGPSSAAPSRSKATSRRSRAALPIGARRSGRGAFAGGEIGCRSSLPPSRGVRCCSAGAARLFGRRFAPIARSERNGVVGQRQARASASRSATAGSSAAASSASARASRSACARSRRNRSASATRSGEPVEPPLQRRGIDDRRRRRLRQAEALRNCRVVAALASRGPSRSRAAAVRQRAQAGERGVGRRERHAAPRGRRGRVGARARRVGRAACACAPSAARQVLFVFPHRAELLVKRVDGGPVRDQRFVEAERAFGLPRRARPRRRAVQFGALRRVGGQRRARFGERWSAERRQIGERVEVRRDPHRAAPAFPPPAGRGGGGRWRGPAPGAAPSSRLRARAPPDHCVVGFRERRRPSTSASRSFATAAS